MTIRRFLVTAAAALLIARPLRRRASWVFNGALDEMRDVFGVHLAGLAAKYGLSVEKDLAAILPSEDETSQQRHASP